MIGLRSLEEINHQSNIIDIKHLIKTQIKTILNRPSFSEQPNNPLELKSRLCNSLKGRNKDALRTQSPKLWSLASQRERWITVLSAFDVSNNHLAGFAAEVDRKFISYRGNWFVQKSFQWSDCWKKDRHLLVTNCHHSILSDSSKFVFFPKK